MRRKATYTFCFKVDFIDLNDPSVGTIEVQIWKVKNDFTHKQDADIPDDVNH